MLISGEKNHRPPTLWECSSAFKNERERERLVNWKQAKVLEESSVRITVGTVPTWNGKKPVKNKLHNLVCWMMAATLTAHYFSSGKRLLSHDFLLLTNCAKLSQCEISNKRSVYWLHHATCYRRVLLEAKCTVQGTALKAHSLNDSNRFFILFKREKTLRNRLFSSWTIQNSSFHQTLKRSHSKAKNRTSYLLIHFLA